MPRGEKDAAAAAASVQENIPLLPLRLRLFWLPTLRWLSDRRRRKTIFWRPKADATPPRFRRRTTQDPRQLPPRLRRQSVAVTFPRRRRIIIIFTIIIDRIWRNRNRRIPTIPCLPIGRRNLPMPRRRCRTPRRSRVPIRRPPTLPPIPFHRCRPSSRIWKRAVLTPNDAESCPGICQVRGVFMEKSLSRYYIRRTSFPLLPPWK